MPDHPPTEPAVRAITRLGVTLLERAAADRTDGVVLSPSSIVSALVTVRVGALGQTATEIDEVLGERNASALEQSLASLRIALDAVDGPDVPQLVLAGAVWLQRGIRLVDSTARRITEAHRVELRTADFAADPDGVVDDVNAWVRVATRDRITELLAAGSLPHDARLVLVDALYLRAPWAEPFLPAATADAPFTTLSGEVVNVPTMRRTEPTRHAASDGWAAVCLDYAGGRLEMVVVVPDRGRFAEVTARSTADLFDRVDATQSVAHVALSLPRFEVTSRLRLRDQLIDLGMPTAFGPDADFGALTTDDRVMIDDVVHASTIVVDEHGTEAAAATAVSMRATGMPLDVLELRVDRPFLFAVRDRPTGAVLFLGRVGDPSR